MADCQTKWRNIRNGFVRSLKPNSSGTSTKQKKLYYLHEELQFVIPYVKASIYNDDNFSMSEETTENIEINPIIDEYVCTQTTTNTSETPPSESVASNPFKRPKLEKDTNDADKAFIELIRKEETKPNARKRFLLSLVPDLDNLTDEQMRKFRIKVLLLLEDIRSEVPP